MINTRLFLILPIFILIVSCGNSSQQNKSSECSLPPEGFSRAALIGSWRAGLEFHSDTLFIRDDGTYKQIIHSDNPPFEYESEWQAWWLDYSENGLPYLHLKGMLLCVYWIGIDCSDTGNEEYQWFDYCKKEWINMSGEGILIVRAAPEGFSRPPRGIWLSALQKSTEDVTGYEFLAK
jgi:hypothetical protein